MVTVLKKQDNGAAIYKVQGLLFEEAGRCNGRLLLARQLDLIDEQIRLDGESPAGACALAAVTAFRCELSRSLLRKDVMQRQIKVMQLEPAVTALVAELRRIVANSY
jgi:hypothetical protein